MLFGANERRVKNPVCTLDENSKYAFPMRKECVTKSKPNLEPKASSTRKQYQDFDHLT